MPGWIMTPLARRLKRCGFESTIYAYHDLLLPLARNAEDFSRFVAALPASVLHFVGHSLGGLLILQLLADHPDSRTGRVVLLGTPYQGSHVARALARSRLTGWLLGRSIKSGLLADRPQWTGQGELGVIAGCRAIGGGMLIAGLPRPHDGMVAVQETRVPGAADSLVLKVNHTEMLFSRAVAQQVCAFLRTGRFHHPPQRPEG